MKIRNADSLVRQRCGQGCPLSDCRSYYWLNLVDSIFGLWYYLRFEYYSTSVGRCDLFLAETSDDKKMDEIPAEDAAKVKPELSDTEATESSSDEQSNVEAVPVEKTDNSDSDDAVQSKQDNESSKKDDESSRKDDESSKKDDESSRRDDRQDSRDGRRGGGYRHERGARGEMSFEEKMRAFKKQSDERLHHIKRSREAKIGKKRTR